MGPRVLWLLFAAALGSGSMVGAPRPDNGKVQQPTPPIDRKPRTRRGSNNLRPIPREPAGRSLHSAHSPVVRVRGRQNGYRCPACLAADDYLRFPCRPVTVVGRLARVVASMERADRRRARNLRHQGAQDAALATYGQRAESRALARCRGSRPGSTR